MEKYTANYSKTNSNFVIQNLNATANKNAAIYPAVCVLKNILMRGNPSNMSDYLKQELPSFNIDYSFLLIDNEVPNWQQTIKGYAENSDYPAVKFFYDIIPKYLSEYCYIQQLLLPEAKIQDIVELKDDRFVNQQVDFYLPQAKLVIEIDGFQHKANKYIQTLDKKRNKLFERNGVDVIRIDADAIKNENDTLLNKIEEIKAILDCYQDLSLETYKQYFTNIAKDLDQYHQNYKATAIIRFQILILSLLEKEIITLNEDEWIFNVLERDITNFVKPALEDIFLWLEPIIKLQGLTEFNRPQIVIHECSESTFKYMDNALNIDFSLTKRWDDSVTSDPNKNIIFVRTDYYDNQNYYRVSTCSNSLYQNLDIKNDYDVKNLSFLLKNTFGYDSFREGQLPSIEHILKGNNTLAVLPTSGGKSLIYQFAGMILPSVIIIVEPILALMKDQNDNLNTLNINNTAFINSTQTASMKRITQNNFLKGLYQYIWLSPERFQSEDFRLSLKASAGNFCIRLVTVDEAHCLSEWGHDFRTSYLNLSKTISRFCSNAKVLCLTATASINVQTDIRNEFDIDREDIKTVAKFTRDELSFVIKNNGRKYNELCMLLYKLKRERNIFTLNGDDTNCGIIFTRNVNGPNGCFELSAELSHQFHSTVKWYSGSKPTKSSLDNDDFIGYKNRVHEQFRNNEFALLVSTKAFGMGIDKNNVRFTIHYGIPESLEALYQEAGRAGRDGNKAACYILITEEIINQEQLDKIFGADTTISEIKDIQKEVGHNGKDIFKNLFLWQSGLDDLEADIDNIYSVFQLAEPNKIETIRGSKLNLSKQKLEKAIYKLGLLGIVDDWVIKDWNAKEPVILVKFRDYNKQSIEDALTKYLANYGTYVNFKTQIHKKSFEKYYDIYNEKVGDEIYKYIKILVNWQYENILYHRRKQIETVYKKCLEFQNKPDKLKRFIESYFYIGDVSYIYNYIVDYPMDYDAWFKVFFEEGKTLIRSNKELKDNKISLIRLLESFNKNIGLNFIAGLLGLLTGDYNQDEKSRFRHAISEISMLTNTEITEILTKVFLLSSNMDNHFKEILSEELIDFFEDRIYEIHDGIKDDYSLSVVLNDSQKRLNEKIGGLL